jgi:serine-threonine kinase receptor-associated protein
VFTGHTSNIKKCLLTDNARKVISISDDKTLRIWDAVSNSKEIFNLKLDHTPNSIELSRDHQLLVLTQGHNVEIYDTGSFNKLYTFKIPSSVSAASINPEKSMFVCAGENFTIYKYSIANATELGRVYFA